jgi:hypothetical protein
MATLLVRKVVQRRLFIYMSYNKLRQGTYSFILVQRISWLEKDEDRNGNNKNIQELT